VESCTNATRSFEAAYSRKFDVKKHYVGRMLLRFRDRLFSGGSLADNVKLGITGQKRTNTSSDDIVVIHNQNSCLMHVGLLRPCNFPIPVVCVLTPVFRLVI
jgi:hypothetical protein